MIVMKVTNEKALVLQGPFSFHFLRNNLNSSRDAALSFYEPFFLEGLNVVTRALRRAVHSLADLSERGCLSLRGDLFIDEPE